MTAEENSHEIPIRHGVRDPISDQLPGGFRNGVHHFFKASDFNALTQSQTVPYLLVCQK